MVHLEKESDQWMKVKEGVQKKKSVKQGVDNKWGGGVKVKAGSG